MRRTIQGLVLSVTFGLWMSAVQAEAPVPAAFFGIVLMNTSLEPVSEAETTRLASLERQLVDSLAESGRYSFIDTSPVAEKADLYSNIADCSGCDATLARTVGAEVSITGIVQKTSNLILHISIFVRDAETGKLVNGGSVDIRGNTDASWERGLRYIVKNRLLRKQGG